MANRPLAPSDNLSIRQPTDGSLQKGNISNPPRYTNLGAGGMNSASPRGLAKNMYAVEPPARTQRKMPNRKVD